MYSRVIHTAYSPGPSSNDDGGRGTGGTPLLWHAEGANMNCMPVQDNISPKHTATYTVIRKANEETPPWSEKLVGNVSKNAKKRHINFIETRGASEEGEDWETDIVMKEDGATKISKGKLLRSRVTSQSGVWVRSSAAREKAGSDGEGDEEEVSPVAGAENLTYELYTTSKLIHSVLDVGKNMRRLFMKFNNNTVGGGGAWEDLYYSNGMDQDFEGSEREINATRTGIVCMVISLVDDEKHEEWIRCFLACFTVKSNARTDKQMHRRTQRKGMLVQMHDANEEREDWKTEIVMKKDGATKTSEDKAKGKAGSDGEEDEEEAWPVTGAENLTSSDS
ncbi:hypothetical protein BS47DRAFT_1386369 [Hydnum rufescens UP504]|uniref:Uncharacterized protein n=1 Tax=Hydnum rufescens UP504 TaxID=1448309 RepID=A0A9P6AF76_9AGAM|nr:hypothetical protein BS47DRAFT_1386369 [Hydnum rufescens UP504]